MLEEAGEIQLSHSSSHRKTEKKLHQISPHFRIDQKMENPMTTTKTLLSITASPLNLIPYPITPTSSLTSYSLINNITIRLLLYTFHQGTCIRITPFTTSISTTLSISTHTTFVLRVTSILTSLSTIRSLITRTIF